MFDKIMKLKDIYYKIIDKKSNPSPNGLLKEWGSHTSL